MGSDDSNENVEPTTTRGVHLNADGTPNYGEKKSYEEGTQNLKLSGYLKSKEGKHRTIHAAIDEALNLLVLVPGIGQAGEAGQAAKVGQEAQAAKVGIESVEAAKAAKSGADAAKAAKSVEVAADTKKAADAAKVAKETSAGTKLVDAGVSGAKTLKNTEAGRKAENLARAAFDTEAAKKAKTLGAGAFDKLSPESQKQLTDLYRDQKKLGGEKAKKAASKAIDDKIHDLRDQNSTGTKTFDSKDELKDHLKNKAGGSGAGSTRDGSDSDSSDTYEPPTDKKGNALGHATFGESFKKQGWDDNRGMMQRAVDGTRDSTGIDPLDLVGMIPLVGGAVEWKLDRDMKKTEARKFQVKAKAGGAALAVLALLFGAISIAGVGGGAANVNAASSTSPPALIGKCGNGSSPDISDTGSDNPVIDQTSANLTEDQKKNAQIIVNTAYEYAATNANKKAAATISIMTAMQESSLVNIKHGDAAGPDSTGLFQQRDSWGPVDVRQSPTGATKLFLDALALVPGWDSMDFNDAAQTVQRSGHPSAYGKWRSLADTVVKDFAPEGSIVGGDSNPDVKPDLYEPDENDPIWKQDLTPDLRNVYKAVKSKWPTEIKDYGANGGGLDHATGMALDAMVPNYKSPQGRALGQEIANYFEVNAKKYGVHYIIWANKIWTDGGTWQAYDGGGVYSPDELNDTTLHYDHVHTSVYGNKGDISLAEDKGASSKPGDSGGDPDCKQDGADSGTGNGVATSGENDYPYKTPLNECAWCRPVDAQGPADPWGLYKRECVSFVAWRMNQQMGWKEGEDYPFTMATMGLSGRGNAQYWMDGLVAQGYAFDHTPAPGAIAWWASNGAEGIGEAGHVAVVKEVLESGKVLIEQYNAYPEEWGYSVQEIDVNFPTGYIHVADVSK